jgi:uncharacterized repeat protein (TIGR01451 family)
MKQKQILLTILVALVSITGLSGFVLPPRPTPRPLPSEPVPPEPLPPEPVPPPLPNLDLTIAANRSEAGINDTVDFTIVLKNPSSRSIRGVRVKGLIPEELKVIETTSSIGSASYNPDTNKTNTFIGVLRPGESVTVKVQVMVKEAVEMGTKFYVAAKVSFKNGVVSEQQFSNWLPVTVVE